MTIPEQPNRLHAQLALMIDLETAMEEKLRELIPIVSDHAGAEALLTKYQSMPRVHRQALETRLNKISDPLPPEVAKGFRFLTDGLTENTIGR